MRTCMATVPAPQGAAKSAGCPNRPGILYEEGYGGVSRSIQSYAKASASEGEPEVGPAAGPSGLMAMPVGLAKAARGAGNGTGGDRRDTRSAERSPLDAPPFRQANAAWRSRCPRPLADGGRLVVCRNSDRSRRNSCARRKPSCEIRRRVAASRRRSNQASI